MSRYATQLTNLVTRYVAIKAELSKRNQQSFKAIVSSARDEMIKTLAVMGTPASARLTVNKYNTFICIPSMIFETN